MDAAIDARRALVAHPWIWILGGLTLLAALVRWPTLAGGSFWYDEWLVHNIMYAPLHRLPDEIASQQTTPPVYYYVAWAWTRVFSPGAASLRGLSGLCGVLTVPVVYATGAVLATRRAGLVAAALVAVNPLLIWYSVEARPYSLLALFGAVSLLCFALALRRPGWPWLVAWGIASGLALGTHYYAVFLVAAEALVLLVALRRHRAMFVAIGVVVAAGAAVTPLALEQLHGTEWIASIPLQERVREIGEGFLVGISPFSLWPVWPLAALFVVGFVLAARGTRRERQSAAIAAGVGALALAFSAVPVIAGADTLLLRNMIAILLPLLVAAGIGLGSERARVVGPVAAAGICAASLALVVAIPLDTGLQRADWGAAVAGLPPLRGDRIIVAWGGYRSAPLFSYAVSLGDPRPEFGEARPKVDEIDLLALRDPGGPGFACWSGTVCGETNVPATPKQRLAGGMRLVRTTPAAGFDVLTYRAPRRTEVDIYALLAELTAWSLRDPRIFIQHGRPWNSVNARRQLAPPG